MQLKDILLLKQGVANLFTQPISALVSWDLINIKQGGI